MNWTATARQWLSRSERVSALVASWQRLRLWRRRLLIFLAVLGPGLITSNVDNDAGGIATYSQVGAQFGYTLLWSLIPLTVALYVSQEMCARMGVVTGKGLSDLIREEFGFRPTFFVMLAGLAVDLGNTIAEFAGVAASLEIFGITRYVSVPLAAVLVWLLVVRRTYRQVEKIFLALCSFYLAYALSAVLAHPDWSAALRQTLVPHVQLGSGYLLMLTALVGTTIAPWQFFYIQASVVEKRINPRQLRHSQADVLLGSVTSMAVVFFIIVATAATLHRAGIYQITDGAQAAQALAPLAGRWAALLFAVGLLNASLFAATILPLSTAHVICEGLGFEAGIDRKLGEAPIFYGLYTALIVLGAGTILLPGLPLLKIMLFSQVANGIWLPIVLIFMLRLVNRRDLMGDRVNRRPFNLIAWATAVTMIVATVVLIGVALAGYA